MYFFVLAKTTLNLIFSHKLIILFFRLLLLFFSYRFFFSFFCILPLDRMNINPTKKEEYRLLQKREEGEKL